MEKKTLTVAALLFCVTISLVAAVAYVYWTSVTIPFEVKGIEITDIPILISQDPGENKTYNITVTNTVDCTYNITLTFNLSDTAYFTDYVTIVADDFYTVTPLGDTVVSFEVQISPAAYPIGDLEFTVDFYIVP